MKKVTLGFCETNLMWKTVEGFSNGVVRSMSTCWAPGCRHYKLRQKCKFYTFPKDIHKLSEWTRCFDFNGKVKPGAVLCSCHFPEGSRKNGPQFGIYKGWMLRDSLPRQAKEKMPECGKKKTKKKRGRKPARANELHFDDIEIGYKSSNYLRKDSSYFTVVADVHHRASSDEEQLADTSTSPGRRSTSEKEAEDCDSFDVDKHSEVIVVPIPTGDSEYPAVSEKEENVGPMSPATLEVDTNGVQNGTSNNNNYQIDNSQDLLVVTDQSENNQDGSTVQHLFPLKRDVSQEDDGSVMVVPAVNPNQGSGANRQPFYVVIRRPPTKDGDVKLNGIPLAPESGCKMTQLSPPPLITLKGNSSDRLPVLLAPGDHTYKLVSATGGAPSGGGINASAPTVNSVNYAMSEPVAPNTLDPPSNKQTPVQLNPINVVQKSANVCQETASNVTSGPNEISDVKILPTNVVSIGSAFNIDSKQSTLYCQPSANPFSVSSTNPVSNNVVKFQPPASIKSIPPQLQNAIGSNNINKVVKIIKMGTVDSPPTVIFPPPADNDPPPAPVLPLSPPPPPLSSSFAAPTIIRPSFGSGLKGESVQLSQGPWPVVSLRPVTSDYSSSLCGAVNPTSNLNASTSGLERKNMFRGSRYIPRILSRSKKPLPCVKISDQNMLKLVPVPASAASMTFHTAVTTPSITNSLPVKSTGTTLAGTASESILSTGKVWYLSKLPFRTISISENPPSQSSTFVKAVSPSSSTTAPMPATSVVSVPSTNVVTMVATNEVSIPTTTAVSMPSTSVVSTPIKTVGSMHTKTTVSHSAPAMVSILASTVNSKTVTRVSSEQATMRVPMSPIAVGSNPSTSVMSQPASPNKCKHAKDESKMPKTAKSKATRNGASKSSKIAESKPTKVEKQPKPVKIVESKPMRSPVRDSVCETSAPKRRGRKRKQVPSAFEAYLPITRSALKVSLPPTPMVSLWETNILAALCLTAATTTTTFVTTTATSSCRVQEGGVDRWRYSQPRVSSQLQTKEVVLDNKGTVENMKVDSVLPKPPVSPPPPLPEVVEKCKEASPQKPPQTSASASGADKKAKSARKSSDDRQPLSDVSETRVHNTNTPKKDSDDKASSGDNVRMQLHDHKTQKKDSNEKSAASDASRTQPLSIKTVKRDATEILSLSDSSRTFLYGHKSLKRDSNDKTSSSDSSRTQLIDPKTLKRDNDDITPSNDAPRTRLLAGLYVSPPKRRQQLFLEDNNNNNKKSKEEEDDVVIMKHVTTFWQTARKSNDDKTKSSTDATRTQTVAGDPAASGRTEILVTAEHKEAKPFFSKMTTDNIDEIVILKQVLSPKIRKKTPPPPTEQSPLTSTPAKQPLTLQKEVMPSDDVFKKPYPIGPRTPSVDSITSSSHTKPSNSSLTYKYNLQSNDMFFLSLSMQAKHLPLHLRRNAKKFVVKAMRDFEFKNSVAKASAGTCSRASSVVV